MAIEIHDIFQTLKLLKGSRYYYSLPALASQGMPQIKRLPISLRIILESLLRNHDAIRVKKEDILSLVEWDSKKPIQKDVPFIVSRVLLQDFTGVPLLVDLAAMRDGVASQGYPAESVEPQVPVDLVIDHSVQVDRSGNDSAFLFNLELEFKRNQERYEFLKWGQEAFKTFKVVPPGIGICHQVNLEHLSSVIMEKKHNDQVIVFFDSLVGTDSHTTMINGLGVVGWGVGGIEAEAAMLGQPVALQTPEVIGFHLKGSLPEAVTATDLTLQITQLLRQEKVVGKFVEFFGEGTETLSVADRATIANMAPEYGATMGFFPFDEKTLHYLQMTGRPSEKIQEIQEYLKAQELFGIPKQGEIDYTKVIELDLSLVSPCVSGPKRPQDRLSLDSLKTTFHNLLSQPISAGGYGKGEDQRNKIIFIHQNQTFVPDLPHQSGGKQSTGSSQLLCNEEEMVTNRPFTDPIVTPGYAEEEGDMVLRHGSVVIAAITSCTNTSNPSVMVAAGLLAKKAVEKGLKVNPLIKTSLAPGSRIVTDYLEKSGLQHFLNQLGFHLVGYGCTTCIGNSGPLEERIEKGIQQGDLVVASVLSGNRNFEARIHSAIQANFLMSPPLVVAFALAGRIDIDLDTESLGKDQKGHPVFLKDIWPSKQEIEATIEHCLAPKLFKTRYANILKDNPVWETILIQGSSQFPWDFESTYIQKPPYFEGFSKELPKLKSLKNLRPLAFFGDSVTTDHISPAGAFSELSPAGLYLLSKGVSLQDFNSYGSRRGNHQVMMRGTFANVRLNNRLADGKEGGFTKLMPEGKLLPIFEACQIYSDRKIPLIIFAGKDYGMGSSRDWAAKGTALLGVQVVVAQSFERIHRSNLIGMGILPLEFYPSDSLETLQLTGKETFSLQDLEPLLPGKRMKLEIRLDETIRIIELLSRLDTQLEVDYYRNGGILSYVLRQILKT